MTIPSCVICCASISVRKGLRCASHTMVSRHWWNHGGREPVAYDRSIDMHVSNLRRKLGPAGDGSERIETIRGIGYQYRIGGKGT